MFDNMMARCVARLGWFANFHAELYNHQDMQAYLLSKMVEKMWSWTLRYLPSMYGVAH